MNSVEIALEVDGRQRRPEVDTRTTLLDALREGLGVTSPKKPRIGDRPSPKTAIDLVFDIQASLLRLMTGTESEHEGLEVAS
jgi:hypothetical protein